MGMEMSIKINLPKGAETALSILHRNNYEAYVVGGCVRDSIMGFTPSDWDIATSAKPAEIMHCFNGYKTIATGIKHGTVTVIIENMLIEITTYRIDGEYTDNRHPDNVSFTDNIAHDLKRRDFTINALAYNNDGIIDLFGGINDIKQKIVKCVGNPNERFNEDGLRILRALRFSSVLNFSIEKNTAESIDINKNLLKNISAERINIEFNKLLMGSNYKTVIINFRGIIEIFLPENSVLSESELNYRLDAMKNLNSLILRLAVLLYKTDSTKQILNNLRYDNGTINTIGILNENIDKIVLTDSVNIKHWLNKIQPENLRNLLKIKMALFPFEKEKLMLVENMMNEIIEKNQCYSLKTLAVNGRDLMNAGIPKGKKVGEALRIILNEVIEGNINNEKNELIAFVNERIMDF